MGRTRKKKKSRRFAQGSNGRPQPEHGSGLPGVQMEVQKNVGEKRGNIRGTLRGMGKLSIKRIHIRRGKGEIGLAITGKERSQGTIVEERKTNRGIKKPSMKGEGPPNLGRESGTNHPEDREANSRYRQCLCRTKNA